MALDFAQLQTRAQAAGEQAQAALKAASVAAKELNGFVVQQAQTLIEAETKIAGELKVAAVATFDKVKTAGIKELFSNPGAFLPEGRVALNTAYQSTVENLAKAKDELATAAFKGYQEVLKAAKAGTEIVVETVEAAADAVEDAVEDAMEAVTDAVAPKKVAAKKKATKAA